MAKDSAIEWTDHTFNTHWGCSKVSPGCDNCYAETLAKRLLPHLSLWDVAGDRRTFGMDHWREPLRWNKKAANDLNAGELLNARRPRVFCNSMSDVFDNHPDIAAVRERLWGLIRATPHLDWLILTKRIGNAKTMLPWDWETGYSNVWLGISVVNQAEADRDIPKLLSLPARIRFLSCEPLLGPINLTRVVLAANIPVVGPINEQNIDKVNFTVNALAGAASIKMGRLDWVIVGGESGHGAREMMGWWALQLRVDCRASKIAFFMKQGSQANWPKFKEFAHFPIALQVREWPK